MMEVCRCFRECWDEVPQDVCYMYGCSERHALKDCPQMKIVVSLHPEFDLDAEHPLRTQMVCTACNGFCVGDPFVYDGAGENVVGYEVGFFCDHCRGVCWCDQRVWVSSEERG
jgi:hypothetical protein